MSDSILFVLPDDNLGGAEQFLKMVALHFQAQYKSVHVIFLKREKHFGWSKLPTNIKLYFANSSTEKGGLLYLAKQVWRLSRIYNLVYAFSSHTHTNSAVGFLRKLHILKTDKLVVRESTLIFRRFKKTKQFSFKLLYKLGYRFANLVICQTELMKNDLLKNIPQANKWNIRVLKNPVNIEMLNSRSEDCSFSDHYSELEYIVAAGRLIKIKGFDILIDAFELLSNKYSNLSLLILGDGEEKQNLTRKVETMGLGEKVKLLGYVENPIPFFKRAKTCVVPSLIEGFPNVLLQMMSQNERVVSTTCAGDVGEIEGLFTCSPGEPGPLAEKIDAALQAKATSKIRGGFDSFLNKHSIDNFVNELFSSL